jgi:hypothetical protein
VKNRFKAVITVLLIVLLATVILTPSMDVLGATSKTPKEQIRSQIENSFSEYLALKNLRFDGSNASIEIFKAFLHSSPTYASYLQKYANLTIAEYRANFPTLQPINMSKAIIQPPFKTSNITINNTTFQMKFSQGSYNGQKFIKICADNGTDPTLELTLNYLTVNIFGVEITYGEFQQFIVSYPAGTDELDFQAWFDPLMQAATGLCGVLWGVMAAASGIACPPVGVAIGFIGGVNTIDVAELQTIVDTQINYGTGIWLDLQNTYIYPWAVLASAPDLSIWASHDGSNYVKAFPYFNNYWCFTGIIAEEATAFTLSTIFHYYENIIGLNTPTYVYLPYMPPGTPPEGPSPLKSVTLNSYDTTASTSANGADVQLDGYSIGTTGSTYPITPETHEFMTSPTWHLYENNYQFFGYEQYGEDNPMEVTVSSDTTVTADYVETQWLYVYAYEPSTGIVETNIYLNGQCIGCGGVEIELPKGSYSVSVDYQTVHWGELVTLDSFYINGEPAYSSDIYLADAPIEMDFVYRFGW